MLYTKYFDDKSDGEEIQRVLLYIIKRGVNSGP